MATFKAEVSPYKKKDGTHNVRIRVYHNGQKRYIETNIFLTKDDFTKTLKIKNQKHIDTLDDIVRRCRETCNENAARLGGMDVNKVVEIVENIIKGNPDKKEGFILDFIQFGRSYVHKLKNEEKRAEKVGRGNSSIYETTLNNLQKYIGRDTLDISEITSKFIAGWIDWIIEQPAVWDRKKGGRAQSLYPSAVRALHNRAKDEFNNEDEGIIRIPQSPFSKVKLPAMPAVRKRAIPPEKIKQIFELSYIETGQQENANRFNLAKDMFILSFCLFGINSVDLYFCDKLQSGRLVYQRIKTHNRRADKAEMSIKIEPEIAAILEKYKDETDIRLFRFHAMYASPQNFNIAINTGLKKIGEIIGENDLEYYAARHSWATIARNRCNIPKYDIHECLNHVADAGMKVTDIYIEKDYSVQDAANRKVLDYIQSLTTSAPA